MRARAIAAALVDDAIVVHERDAAGARRRVQRKHSHALAARRGSRIGLAAVRSDHENGVGSRFPMVFTVAKTAPDPVFVFRPKDFRHGLLDLSICQRRRLRPRCASTWTPSSSIATPSSSFGWAIST